MSDALPTETPLSHGPGDVHPQGLGAHPTFVTLRLGGDAEEVLCSLHLLSTYHFAVSLTLAKPHSIHPAIRSQQRYTYTYSAAAIICKPRPHKRVHKVQPLTGLSLFSRLGHPNRNHTAPPPFTRGISITLPLLRCSFR